MTRSHYIGINGTNRGVKYITVLMPQHRNIIREVIMVHKSDKALFKQLAEVKGITMTAFFKHLLYNAKRSTTQSQKKKRIRDI